MKKCVCVCVYGFSSGSDGKASVCNAGDPGSIPGLERSTGEGNGSPLVQCISRVLFMFSALACVLRNYFLQQYNNRIIIRNLLKVLLFLLFTFRSTVHLEFVFMNFVVK